MLKSFFLTRLQLRNLFWYILIYSVQLMLKYLNKNQKFHKIKKKYCLPPNHDVRLICFLGVLQKIISLFLYGWTNIWFTDYLEHIRNTGCSGREVLRPTKMSSVHRCLMPNAAAVQRHRRRGIWGICPPHFFPPPPHAKRVSKFQKWHKMPKSAQKWIKVHKSRTKCQKWQNMLEVAIVVRPNFEQN